VQTWILNGDAFDRKVTSDEAGNWTLDLSGTADLAPGWRASVIYRPLPEIKVVATQVIPYLEIGVHTDGLFGLAAPGTPVTATLYAPDGRQKSQSSARSSAAGEFRLKHGGGGGFSPFGADVVRAEPGDRLELAFISGDPQVYTIPDVTASVDLEADSIEGVATPGASLWLRFDSPGGIPPMSAVAERSGDYRFDLAGEANLAPGVSGRLLVRAGSAHAFSLPWAAPRLNLEIGSGEIAGTAAPGRSAEAQLFAPDGSLLGEAEAEVLDDTLLIPDLDPELFASLSGSFTMEFLDVAGDPVPLEPGDRVRLTSGDNQAEAIVPAMDGVVFVDQGLVTGRTEPGRALDLSLRGFDGSFNQIALTADERGNFSHAWGAEIDLQYNDQVGLGTQVEGHSVIRALNVPGLFLDLDASLLSGSLRPEAAFRVSARRAGRLMAEGQGFASESGVFRLRLVDAAGAPIELKEGDQIEVAPQGQAGERLTLLVPRLEIEADAQTDLISGNATPGGSLTILARDALQGRFALSQAWPLIADDGRWAADLIPGWDVAPGTAVDAQYRLPVGHVVSRTHYEPLLRVEHSGPNVCGFAPPGGDLQAQLSDASGSMLAQTDGRAGMDGRFQLGFDADGADVDPDGLRILEGGQRVDAMLGGVRASVALPELDIAIDWQSGRISGTGPADTFFEIAFPAQRCIERVGGGDFFGFAMLSRTGPDGAIQGGLPIPVQPGEGIEMSFIQPDGHLAYRQFYRLLGEVFVDTERVRGMTVGGGLVQARLMGPGGDLRAEVEGRADADGQFDLRFLDAGGEPIAIAAGDNVTLSAGGESPSVRVETLGFDWSRGDRVVGEAPAGRPLQLDLKLEDGRLRSIEREADENGRFSFDVDELPPRGGWTLDDIVGLRLTMMVGGGHRIIAQTEDFDAPAVAPEPEGPSTIFLPRVSTSRAGEMLEALPGSRADDLHGRWVSVSDHFDGNKNKVLAPIKTQAERNPTMIDVRQPSYAFIPGRFTLSWKAQARASVPSATSKAYRMGSPPRSRNPRPILSTK
jgi:hypothetical protein